MADELGRSLEMGEVKDAIMDGLGREFDATFEEGGLTQAEEDLADELMGTYLSREWNLGPCNRCERVEEYDERFLGNLCSTA